MLKFRKTPKGEISFDSLVDLLTVVCFLFGRIKVYEMPLKISDNDNDYEPKFAALPPVAPFVLETLQGFNTMLTSTYKSYIDSIAAISSSEDLPVTLPISGISFSCLNTREVEPLSELAGVGRVDEGESAGLASNLRADLMTDTMPGIDIEESISGYARAFFKSGEYEERIKGKKRREREMEKERKREMLKEQEMEKKMKRERKREMLKEREKEKEKKMKRERKRGMLKEREKEKEKEREREREKKMLKERERKGKRK